MELTTASISSRCRSQTKSAGGVRGSPETSESLCWLMLWIFFRLALTCELKQHPDCSLHSLCWRWRARRENLALMLHGKSTAGNWSSETERFESSRSWVFASASASVSGFIFLCLATENHNRTNEESKANAKRNQYQSR